MCGPTVAVVVVAVSLLETSLRSAAAHPSAQDGDTTHQHVGSLPPQGIDDAAEEMCNRWPGAPECNDVHSSHHGAVYILCTQTLGITKGIGEECSLYEGCALYDSYGILSNPEGRFFCLRSFWRCVQVRSEMRRLRIRRASLASFEAAFIIDMAFCVRA